MTPYQAAAANRDAWDSAIASLVGDVAERIEAARQAAGQYHIETYQAAAANAAAWSSATAALIGDVADRIAAARREAGQYHIEAYEAATANASAWDQANTALVEAVAERIAAAREAAGRYHIETYQAAAANRDAWSSAIAGLVSGVAERIAEARRQAGDFADTLDSLSADRLREIHGQITATTDSLREALDDLVGERYGERLAAALDPSVAVAGLGEAHEAILRVREASSDLPLQPLTAFREELAAVAGALALPDAGHFAEIAEEIREAGVSDGFLVSRLADFRAAINDLNTAVTSINPDTWEAAVAPFRSAAWAEGASAASTLRAEIELLDTAYQDIATSEVSLREAIAGTALGGEHLANVLAGLQDDAAALAAGTFESSEAVRIFRAALREELVFNTGPALEAIAQLEASFGRQVAGQEAIRQTTDSVADTYIRAYQSIVTGGEAVAGQLESIGGENRELSELTVGEMIQLGQQAAETVQRVGDTAQQSAEGSVRAIEGAAATIGPILGAGSDAFTTFGGAASTAGENVASATDTAQAAVASARESIATDLSTVQTELEATADTADSVASRIAAAAEQAAAAVAGAATANTAALATADAALAEHGTASEQSGARVAAASGEAAAAVTAGASANAAALATANSAFGQHGQAAEESGSRVTAATIAAASAVGDSAGSIAAAMAGAGSAFGAVAGASESAASRIAAAASQASRAAAGFATAAASAQAAAQSSAAAARSAAEAARSAAAAAAAARSAGSGSPSRPSAPAPTPTGPTTGPQPGGGGRPAPDDGDFRRPLPFADGGIVTRPTIGLLAENGPEAVIPLRGGPGAAGVVVNNRIVVNGSLLAPDTLLEMVEDVTERAVARVSR